MLSSNQLIYRSIFILVILAGISSSLAAWKYGYQSGYDAAKAKIQKSGLFSVSDDVQVTNLIGTVSAVNGKTLRIETPMLDPFASEALNVREIVISDSTKIEKIVPPTKEPKALSLEEAQRMIPMEPEKAAIQLGEIKVGDMIEVTSVTDIKGALSITPVTVLVLPQVTPPQGMGN